MISRQALLFVVAGGIAAAVNFLSRIALSWSLPYAAAIVGAYVLGMVTAFVLNRMLVFTQANNQLHHQVLWFVAVNLAALLQTLAISLLLARVVFPRCGFGWHPETVAHAIGIMVPIMSSYWGHKHLSFRTQPSAE